MKQTAESSKFSIMSYFMKYGHITDYEKCRKCNYIVKVKKRGYENPCPRCNGPLILWPADTNLFVLIERFYTLKEENKESLKELSIILFCTIFEGLFDNFIIEYLKRLNTNKKIIKLLIRRYGSIESRVGELYNQIVGEKFNIDLKNIGYEEFYTNWKIIKKARNDYIHFKMNYIKKEVVNKTYKMLPLIFEIFKELNNKYLLTIL